MRTILEKAKSAGQKTLSEYESKIILREAGIPVNNERLASSAEEAVEIAEELTYPVVLKGVSANLTHKTEHNMVRVGIRDRAELVFAFNELIAGGPSLDGILVCEMIRGNRELVAGLMRDPSFGPTVMLGLGGIFTEILRDTSFRIAPLSRDDAFEMISELKSSEMLDEFRGSPAVDRDVLADILVSIGDLAVEQEDIREIDINPMIITGNRPVAVDALIVLKD